MEDLNFLVHTQISLSLPHNSVVAGDIEAFMVVNSHFALESKQQNTDRVVRKTSCSRPCVLVCAEGQGVGADPVSADKADLGGEQSSAEFHGSPF